MKNKIIFIIVIPVIIIMIGILVMIKPTNNESKVEKEDAKKLNEIINDNFFRYVEDFDNLKDIDYISAINLVIFKNKLDEQLVSDIEKNKLGLDTKHRLYSVSKEYVDSELKTAYEANVLYEYIENTIEEDRIRIIRDNKVYYTIPTDEYIFIATKIDKNNNTYEVEVSEYKVTDINKQILEDSLENGKIPKNEKINNNYKMKIEQNKFNNKYYIKSKKTIK